MKMARKSSNYLSLTTPTTRWRLWRNSPIWCMALPQLKYDSWHSPLSSRYWFRNAQACTENQQTHIRKTSAMNQSECQLQKRPFPLYHALHTPFVLTNTRLRALLARDIQKFSSFRQRHALWTRFAIFIVPYRVHRVANICQNFYFFLPNKLNFYFLKSLYLPICQLPSDRPGG